MLTCGAFTLSEVEGSPRAPPRRRRGLLGVNGTTQHVRLHGWFHLEPMPKCYFVSHDFFVHGQHPKADSSVTSPAMPMIEYTIRAGPVMIPSSRSTISSWKMPTNPQFKAPIPANRQVILHTPHLLPPLMSTSPGYPVPHTRSRILI